MKITEYVPYCKIKFESVYVDGMGMMIYDIYKLSLLGYYPLGCINLDLECVLDGMNYDI